MSFDLDRDEGLALFLSEHVERFEHHRTNLALFQVLLRGGRRVPNVQGEAGDLETVARKAPVLRRDARRECEEPWTNRARRVVLGELPVHPQEYFVDSV